MAIKRKFTSKNTGRESIRKLFIKSGSRKVGSAVRAVAKLNRRMNPPRKGQNQRDN